MQTYSYIRVSSAEQLKGDGPERQQVACRACCTLNGYPDPKIVVDATKGKNELKDRENMKLMMAEIEAMPPAERKEVIVIVEKPDRLARALMVSEMFLCRFQKMGVKVVSAEGNIDITEGDADNPMAKLVRVILGAIAEFDKDNIVNRTRAARNRIKAAGKKCEGGIGYGDTTKRPSNEEKARARDERAVIVRMFALRDAGASYRDIARDLNRDTTPRRGQEWTPTTIILIMKRVEREGKAPTVSPEDLQAARERLEWRRDQIARRERLRVESLERAKSKPIVVADDLKIPVGLLDIPGTDNPVSCIPVQ